MVGRHVTARPASRGRPPPAAHAVHVIAGCTRLQIADHKGSLPKTMSPSYHPFYTVRIHPIRADPSFHSEPGS